MDNLAQLRQKVLRTMNRLLDANTLATCNVSHLDQELTKQRRLTDMMRRAGLTISFLVLLMPALALVGWIFNITILKSASAGAVAMNPATAVAFLLAGSCLWLRRRCEQCPRMAQWAMGCAATALLIGLIRFIGYLHPSLDIGVDRWLFSARLNGNQMAPNTALNFVFLGFVLIGAPSRTAAMRWTAQTVALLTFALALTAVLGYAYRVPAFYTVGNFQPMAVHTAFAFLLSSCAILLMYPGQGPLALLHTDGLGGMMARRLLLPCLVILAVLTWIELMGQWMGWYSPQVGAAGLILIIMALLVALVCRSSVLLNRLDNERKEAIASLGKAKAAAEVANQSKSAFLAHMSHEIRTPLTAISGFADLLQHPARSPEDRVSDAQVIRRNAEHLVTIINDILDLSKIEAGKMVIERIVCAPSQIIAEVASMLRNRANDKGLYLRVEYEGGIPTSIRTDPTRLRQSLINLISNAIKFTDKGGIRVVTRMATGTTDPRPLLEIAVIDSGIGMTTQQQQTIFDPFVQGDASVTRRFGGTGLGLAITRQLITMMGGDITFASEESRGSSFTMTIETGSLSGVPLHYDMEEASTAGWHLPRSSPVSQLQMRGTVLLAEDGPENQELIATYLRQAGASVEIADNGKIACEMALAARDCRRQYDLILMDMQMPEMDGYTATRTLRNQRYTGPIVALTAHAMSQDREKCLNAGCNEFLTKPIDREKLLKVVRSHLAEAPAQADAASQDAEPDMPPEALLAMRSIMQRFINKLPERIASIEQACERQDRTKLKELAHLLKGTAANLEMKQLAERAATLEQAAQGDWPWGLVAESAAEFISLCRKMPTVVAA